tara:strand:+ start:220 stop:678 length:459 start_codon:yes stop_codon:yes gene_type:complete
MTDSDTTNIQDLPIHPGPVTNNNDEVIQNLNLTTQQRQLDDHSISNNEEAQYEKKHVSFGSNTIHGEETQKNFELTIELKIIVLATFFFFVFMDSQFKRYILNICVQIFGSYLKTETNQMSKLGMFVYSLCYGLLLWSIVSFIDLTSFHLAF